MARAKKETKTPTPEQVQNEQQTHKSAPETTAAENAELPNPEATSESAKIEGEGPAENVQPEAATQPETTPPAAGAGAKTEVVEKSTVQAGVDEVSAVQSPADGLAGNEQGVGESGQESPESDPESELLSLDELARSGNIPGWQQAALCRLMGWKPGKKVSHEEYTEALAGLTFRRQGSTGR